ncbi:MAG: zinc ribbon domain-containing protein [Gemmatimonadetes bacterium]|nr:zinc ribbon domain-containing protein [Gemmatimonadota bacterium]
MAKPSKSQAAIQKLLAERVEVERWLERLSLAGDKTPEGVRDKIKSDYQKRLVEIVKELTAFGDELAEALKRHQATREGLVRQEQEAAEKMAEAEVRHAVGEYDESKWRQLNAEHLSTLVKIREELKNAEEEITRLEETVAGLKASPATAAPSDAAPEPAAPPSGQAKAAPVDELAFLKSVTEDEQHGPSPTRASGTQRVPEHIAAKPAPPPPPPPPPPEPPPKPKVDVGAGGVAPIDSSGPGKRLTGKLEKSLKCKECGTMNMPTEWYCEKCGAEITQV